MKTLFRIFAVIMILGLLLGTVAPILLSLSSSNSTDANQDQTEETSTDETIPETAD